MTVTRSRFDRYRIPYHLGHDLSAFKSIVQEVELDFIEIFEAMISI